MMKSERIFLHLWEGEPGDNYLDIPWPDVHRQTGVELINWLNSQDTVDVQMIMEQEHGGWQSLWAEFYKESTRIQFALKFAR
jgi:hypothetical protein